MLQKPARVGTVILFLIGFVPYPLCFGGMIVCRCVIYYMILVLWLVLTSNVFLLLEVIRCVSEECAWVEVLPVMFRPGCLKIASFWGGPTNRKLFQVSDSFSASKAGQSYFWQRKKPLLSV